MSEKENFQIASLMVIPFLFFSLLFPAIGETYQINSVDKPKEVGQKFVTENVELYPEWQGAYLVGNDPCYDLKGQVIAYAFAIQKDDQTLGRIVVGNSMYDWNVLEAGSEPYPSLPSISELKTAIEQDLGIRIKERDIEQPLLLYLGYNSFFSIFKVKGQSIAFDLQFKHALSASELKSRMVSPEDYKLQKGEDSSITSYYFSLNVPMEYQSRAPYPFNSNNCGPTSGAMIVEWYKNQGYPNFDGWPADHNCLYVTMQTNSGSIPGTMPWNAGPGFSAYAAEKGYYFSNYWEFPYYETFSLITGFLQNYWPIMILFYGSSPYVQYHWCVIRGYELRDSTKFLLLNNPWGSYDSVNWDANYNSVSIHYLTPH